MTDRTAASPRGPGWNRASLLCALILLIIACNPPAPAPLPHEAYVWQRQWTPAVVAALAQPDLPFAAWRVLALQVVGNRSVLATPDVAALAASARPVRLVVRIEGARMPIAVPALLAQLQPLLANWQAAGVHLVGVEIDHDCASAALADYARWLAELRAALPAQLKLSITALPTWLDAPELDGVLAISDESVLQVHAVARPQQGLFDEKRALAWARRYAERTPRPFALALPAYGVRVATGDDGAVSAVDGEGEWDRAGPGAVELRAEPQQLAGFLAALRGARLAHLSAIVWFRLPVAGDRRAYSPGMLAAMIAGRPLRAAFRAETLSAGNGSSDVFVHNVGNTDGPPPSVKLPEYCRFGDALGHYRLQRDGQALRLAPAADAWLRAGDRERVGWARCNQQLNREWNLP